MKYRCRTEIVSMILDAATSAISQTKIMYNAYLSYTQVKEYLKFLQENGLIYYQQGSQLYIITDKGRKFLKLYMQIGEIVSMSSEENLPKILV